MLNKHKGVMPDYKKYKKTNPLYKLHKFDYKKKLHVMSAIEEEEDDDIREFLEHDRKMR